MEIEQAKPILDQMELRHQELSKLANNIRDLHDMFFDISHLILFQV
jgi:t-SNARE complex subunit (syntaxin)